MDLTVDLYICGIYNNIVVKYDFMFLRHLSWAKRKTGKSLCGPATVSRATGASGKVVIYDKLRARRPA